MTNPATYLISYFRSAKAELEKVSWPTRQDTLRYSLLVVGVSAVTAIFFAALDFGLGQAVDLALSRHEGAAVQNEPVTPQTAPIVEGVDENGNTVPVKITPIPVNGGDGSFKVNN